MAIPLPMRAPASTSPGKWTPTTTREMPTMSAQANITIDSPPKIKTLIVAIQNAAEVWPEGKLNLSEAVIKEWKLGLKSAGLSRFKVFFKM